MIRFSFSMFGCDNAKLKKTIFQNKYIYPDILEINGEFQIAVNENVFFSEPHFPILEFLKDALEWINCSDEEKEMSYSSMETETNPLITFLKKDNGWIIRSPWQKYECKNTFTKAELASAILNLVEAI